MAAPKPDEPSQPAEDYSALETLPATYQAVHDFAEKQQPFNPFPLRRETFTRIEKATGRPLISYVTRTRNVAPGIPAYIDDSDLSGISDLPSLVEGDAVDVFLISNGGSPEASERIVRLLRGKFKSLRFIVPSNAFSAATLICFSGDSVLMGPLGTMGPIDPQINGIPARAILRAFENLEVRLKAEGARALTAYMPLIAKYDLHILEICKSAQELAAELAREWLSTYMLKRDSADAAVTTVVEFFHSYDVHKSHGRSIDRVRAREKGLADVVADTESVPELTDLIHSLLHQYDLWFENTPFYKMYEDARGTHWGRQGKQTVLPLSAPLPPAKP